MNILCIDNRMATLLKPLRHVVFYGECAAFLVASIACSNGRIRNGFYKFYNNFY